MRSVALVGAALLLGVIPGIPRDGLAQESRPGFVVVVHPDNPVATLTRDQVSRIFLKRTIRWEDGTQILPVDLARTAPVRELFSRAVLHRPADAIAAHWQQQIFSGRGVPPPELDSEARVAEYVRRNLGAIGYLAAATNTAGLRVVAVR